MSPVEVKVRPVAARDRHDLAEIVRQLDSYHVGRVPSVFQRHEEDEATLFERMPLSPERFMLCAEEGGRAVGLVYFFIREAPPYPILKPRRYLLVENLAVLEEYRGRGIGTALMRAVEEKGKELGIQDVQLTVWEANPEAIRFYEKLGYRTILRTMRKLEEESV